ncbi:MAG: YlxR family protein [bacterium]
MTPSLRRTGRRRPPRPHQTGRILTGWGSRLRRGCRSWVARVVVRVVERTCVGCRRRSPADELLRVVAAGIGSPPTSWAVVPDPARRAGGRGAWLHPDQDCADLAVRRRAFARALRVPGPLDTRAVAPAVTAASTTQVSRAPTPTEDSAVTGAPVRGSEKTAMSRR